MAFKYILPLVLLSTLLLVNCQDATKYSPVGPMTRQLLVDNVTGERYIRDGDWLYRVLTDGARTTWDGRKYIVDGNVLRYTEAPVSEGIRDGFTDCLIFRDTGIDGTTDWVLDSKRVFFDKDSAKTLRTVGYTNGRFLDTYGPSDVRTAPHSVDLFNPATPYQTYPSEVNAPTNPLTSTDLLKIWQKYAEAGFADGTAAPGAKPLTPKDALKRMKKFKEYVDLANSLGLTVTTPPTPGQDLSKPANFLDVTSAEVNDAEAKKVVKHDTSSVTETPEPTTIDPIKQMFAQSALERVAALRKSIFDFKKQFITMGMGYPWGFVPSPAFADTKQAF